MIITRTPFRVTLGGGGTDLPSYYSRYGGLVFAMGITSYMYVMVNHRVIDRRIILHYSQSETVETIDEIRHDLVREALRHHDVTDAVEISSVADLPAGTGVGSSGSFIVGLLLALHHYRRDFVTLQALAEEACHLELDVLRKRVGKQDQYAAAFGGLTVLDIASGGAVRVERVVLGLSALADLAANTHLYYTGSRRDALAWLAPQDTAMADDRDARHGVVAESLHRIKEIGARSIEAIRDENFDRWGELLDEHWRQKRRMVPNVSPSRVDAIYDEVRTRFGVLGGKIVGAGGGGFLLLYCPRGHKPLERFMAEQGMPRLHYAVEPHGAKLVGDFSR
ncbi:MAG: galactokinase [Acidobacteriota bacterium]